MRSTTVSTKSSSTSNLLIENEPTISKEQSTKGKIISSISSMRGSQSVKVGIKITGSLKKSEYR